MTETLTELLARCAGREEGAIEILVARFQPAAHSIAGALLHDKSLAPDVVQESFLVALEKLGDLREAEAFPGWFRQIVRTQSSRVNRRRTDNLLDEDRPLECPRPTPRDEAARRALQSAVRKAVHSLPSPGRETAEMFYFQEMRHTEIAESLHVPLGTVKRRLYDARRTLRTLLIGFVEDSDK